MAKFVSKITREEARLVNPKAMEFLDFCEDKYGPLFNDTMHDIAIADKSVKDMNFDEIQKLFHRVMVLKQVVEKTMEVHVTASKAAISDLDVLQTSLMMELQSLTNDSPDEVH